MESFFHTPFFLSFLSIAQSKRYGREEVSADCLVSFPWTGKSSLHQKQGKRRGVRGDVPNTFTLWGGGLSGDSMQQERLSTKVNHTVFNIHLWHTNNYGSNTSFPLHTPNNSPLFIRPITVNSKYLLLSADEYRPNMVAVLFGCSLNVESKYASFSIGSPSACCKKFVTTLLLEYGRRSNTGK